jgi:long-chain acyl-CoA synthetase
MIERRVDTMDEAFLAQVQQRGEAAAIVDANLDVVLSWRDYGMAARRVAAGLAALGLGRRDTVGLLLRNPAEFHVADTAALLLAATPFSMYNTSAPEQLAHLLADTRCRIVLTEQALHPRLSAAMELCAGTVEHVIDVESPSWERLFTAGELDAACAARPDDIAVLIYTSGTTGPPKGVELSHRNIATVAAEIADRISVDEHHRAISYLPMAHIAERASTHYLPMMVGLTTVCCPDPGQVTALLPRVQPELFFSPPRLWEKLRAAIAPELAAGADLGDIVHRTGFGRLQTALVGAAPCPPAVKEFFASIGIPLREVYGLSETTGVVSISDRADTVGLPLPSAEVRLACDGELLVRGPLVMTGYRNRREATAEAIDNDGWLHTGDIARIDDDGQLRIIDRKKELIINAAGKNMSPANIEARLKESGGLISQACVIGNGRPYNVALIVPDLALAAAYPTSAALTAALQADVDRANERLARVEQIKRFAVLSTEWLPDSDELTATMKLKRREIEKKYAAHIDALYQ